MPAPLLMRTAAFVLTSLDSAHENYQADHDALLAAAEGDARFVLLKQLDLSSHSTIHVMRLTFDEPCDAATLRKHVASLGDLPATATGRSIVVVGVADRGSHRQAAQALLRELDEVYAEAVSLPSQHGELVTAWAGLSGGWVLVLLDPAFSDDGRLRIEAMLTNDLYLCGEALWHKVLRRMWHHETVRAQFTKTQWAQGLKEALQGDSKAVIPTFRAGGAQDNHVVVAELDAAARYVAVSQYALEAGDSSLQLLLTLSEERFVAEMIGARKTATEAYLKQVNRDQGLIKQLADVARWNTEQEQKVALDQIQAIGLLITVAGLSLAAAQLWAASTDEMPRSVGTFMGLLLPSAVLCSLGSLLVWLTNDAVSPRLKGPLKTIKDFVQRILGPRRPSP